IRSTTTTRCRLGACSPMGAWRTSMREEPCCLFLPAVHSVAWWGLAGVVLAALLLGGSGASLAQAPIEAAPAGPAASAAPVIGLGQPLPAEEIARYAFTVFPDGRNL